MTPCEERGWKVGDRFRVVKGPCASNYSIGETLVLHEDDGTEVPFFYNESRGSLSCCTIDKIERIEWNGPADGLPPVGAECEVSADHGEWFLCEIVGHHKGMAVMHCENWSVCGDYAAYPASRFRPIKSDRERAIDELSSETGISFNAAGRVYDAGYRKTEDKV